jgi:hypothetical protein
MTSRRKIKGTIDGINGKNLIYFLIKTRKDEKQD